MKQALCVTAEQATNETDNSKWELFLLPREGENNCEDNLNYLQIIPYITILDRSTSDIKLLTYLRGNLSDEKRLINKRSVGFGGHMDTLPLDGDDLDTHIAKETIRELNEELGINDLTIEKMIEIINTRSNWIFPTPESNATDKVHLGVNLIVYTDEFTLTNSPEQGHICDVKFVNLYKLKMQMVIQQTVNKNSLNEIYENWSELVIEQL